jgi:hypothetical protein
MPGLAEVVRGLAARDEVEAVVLVSPEGCRSTTPPVASATPMPSPRSP